VGEQGEKFSQNKFQKCVLNSVEGKNDDFSVKTCKGKEKEKGLLILIYMMYLNLIIFFPLVLDSDESNIYTISALPHFFPCFERTQKHGSVHFLNEDQELAVIGGLETLEERMNISLGIKHKETVDFHAFQRRWEKDDRRKAGSSSYYDILQLLKGQKCEKKEHDQSFELSGLNGDDRSGEILHHSQLQEPLILSFFVPEDLLATNSSSPEIQKSDKGSPIPSLSVSGVKRFSETPQNSQEEGHPISSRVQSSALAGPVNLGVRTRSMLRKLTPMSAFKHYSSYSVFINTKNPLVEIKMEIIQWREV
jgi:hypothetical protein